MNIIFMRHGEAVDNAKGILSCKEIMKVSGAEVIIDNRIREIDWGEYDGKPNNPELDAVRVRQAAGDFFR